jgi:azurin
MLMGKRLHLVVRIKGFHRGPCLALTALIESLGFWQIFRILHMKKLLLLLAALIAAPLAPAQTHARVEITCNDEMKFNQKSFEVEVGQKVTLVFKNVGKIPIEKMAHNLVILMPGTDLLAFAAKCGDPKAGYLPADAETKKRILAHTKRLGGGDSDTIYFIPKEAGDYPFVCTTPGHFTIMQGVMKVKAKTTP